MEAAAGHTMGWTTPERKALVVGALFFHEDWDSIALLVPRKQVGSWGCASLRLLFSRSSCTSRLSLRRRSGPALRPSLAARAAARSDGSLEAKTLLRFETNSQLQT